ncbi:uroporphyrinogen-III C-methyltransferase, partial [Vibrio parahaemolyticus V-223/04]
VKSWKSLQNTVFNTKWCRGSLLRLARRLTQVFH